nr:MAG TPA: hypothetical protein [Caudoviricetes sp.]
MIRLQIILIHLKWMINLSVECRIMSITICQNY